MARQKSTHVDSPAAAGARVRELREKLGLRQRDLAFAGCTPAYISRIEAGARTPSLQLLREIGKRLGVDAEYLATGRKDPAGDEQFILADAQLAQRLGDAAAAEEGLSRLHDSANPRIRRTARLGLGQLALERGEIEKAVELLEGDSQPGEDDQPVDPAAVEALAHAYSTGGDLAGALALLERTLPSVADDPVARFRLSVILANVLIDLGQLDRAETVIGDVRGELGRSPDPIAQARCLWSQSRLQTARGSHDLAARYAEDALAIIKTTEHGEYAARAHQVLAYIELERGEPARALALLDQALPLIQAGGDEPLIAVFQLERARALADLGEFDQAREIASELVVTVEGLSRVDSARALAVLASVFTKTGDTERALVLYEAAADELAGRPHAPMLVQVYTRWSDLLAESGDTEKALAVARRALVARSLERQ